MSASGGAWGSYAIPGFGKYAWVWKAFGPVCGRYASLRKRAREGLGQMKNAVEGAGRLRKRVRLTALQKTSRRRKACGQHGFAQAGERQQASERALTTLLGRLPDDCQVHRHLCALVHVGLLPSLSLLRPVLKLRKRTALLLMVRLSLDGRRWVRQVERKQVVVVSSRGGRLGWQGRVSLWRTELARVGRRGRLGPRTRPSPKRAKGRPADLGRFGRGRSTDGRRGCGRWRRLGELDLEVARPSDGRSNVVELDRLAEVFQGTFLAVSNRVLGASGQR